MPELSASGRELAKRFLARVPAALTAVSSTSFPFQFNEGCPSQDIIERKLFDYIRNINPDASLIYSDRASARIPDFAPRSRPRPRVDLALANQWLFFVAEDNPENTQVRNELYGLMADLAVASEAWDDNLKIWGTKQIKGLARRDPSCRASPMLITAYRINIHLRRQIYYLADRELISAQEKWQD